MQPPPIRITCVSAVAPPSSMTIRSAVAGSLRSGNGSGCISVLSRKYVGSFAASFCACRRCASSPYARYASSARLASPKNPRATYPTYLRDRTLALHRQFAPGTEIPELPGDSPFATPAAVLAALQLPGLLHLRAAPRAVAHERHQRLAAASVRTAGGIALVAVAPIGVRFEAGTVTPGAIIPVQFQAALAAGALRRHPGRRAARGIVDAAPGAGLHALRNRAFAAAALVARVEHPLVQDLELPPLLLPPGRRLRHLAPRVAAPRPARAALQALVCVIHLDGVAIPVGWVELDCAPQERN